MLYANYSYRNSWPDKEAIDSKNNLNMLYSASKSTFTSFIIYRYISSCAWKSSSFYETPRRSIYIILRTSYDTFVSYYKKNFSNLDFFQFSECRERKVNSFIPIFRGWLAANSVLAVKWLLNLHNSIDLRDANIFSIYVSLTCRILVSGM